MQLRFTGVLILCCSTFGVCAAAVLQDSGAKPASEPAGAQAARSAGSRNLIVLPADISDGDLAKLMIQYDQFLGVPCGYCHAQNADTKQIDYASNENPLKQTARVMITMTSDINNKYLTEVGDRRYANPITCGNCHRGQPQPPDFGQ